MILLAMIPFVLLILKGIFFWNKKCVDRISKSYNVMFWNVYIRFGLEAYLELCLSSLLRFKNFTFDTNSEKFHSIFATVIFVGVVAYLALSIFFLQWRYPKLDTQAARNCYGDLYLGLKTRERTAILSPFIFLLRRILFASILVSWSERSYF